MRFSHMADEMSYDGGKKSGKRGLPALVVIIASVILLNIIAGFDADLAMGVAIGVVAIAALTFLVGVILGVLRRK